MQSSESGGRLKRIVRRFGLFLMSLTIFLLLSEVAVRALTDTVPPMTVRDSVLGRRYRANYAGRHVNPESEREVDLRFNARGFRGPDYAEAKPANTVRIAVLGDSMIAALSVDEHETAVGILQAKLAERFPETNWEVINFGVSGSSTWQECIVYQEEARKLDPDLVVCSFFTGNDLADNSTRLTSNPRIYFDFNGEGELVKLPLSSGRAGLSRWLNTNSRFYVWQKGAKKSLRAANTTSGPPSLSPGHLIYASNPDENVKHAWSLAEAALGKLKSAVAADDREFMLFLMPNAADVYANVFEGVCEAAKPRGFEMEQDLPTRRLAEIAEASEIRFLSLVDRFRAAAPSSDCDLEAEWLFHKGRWHLDENGNRLVAECLFEELTTKREGEEVSLAERLAAN